MTRSHPRRFAVASAILLFGLVLTGPGAVAGASSDRGGTSAEHRDDAAAAHAQDKKSRAAHDEDAAADSSSSDEQAAALREPQPASNADFTGNGANDTGAYDSTRDGSPSLNGNGGGAAVGRPCAGCVGKADNKNPPGQFPDGSDANKGYECDDNSGIGRTNPAHTGCVRGTDVPTVTETPLDVLGVTFTRTTPAVAPAAVAPAGSLAATGAGFGLTTLALSGLAMILVGALLFGARRRTGAYAKA